MLVGTNTVAVDDPELTVRDEYDEPLPHQPLRVVMGERDLPESKRVFNDRAETLQLRTRDPEKALAELFARDRQHVFLEGGPRLAAAFLRRAWSTRWSSTWLRSCSVPERAPSPTSGSARSRLPSTCGSST
jgi:riboflavin biosynthesis pyrimidine reductase